MWFETKPIKPNLTHFFSQQTQLKHLHSLFDWIRSFCFGDHFFQLLQSAVSADEIENCLNLGQDYRVELFLHLIQNVFVAHEPSGQGVHLKIHFSRFEHQVARDIHSIADEKKRNFKIQ